MAAALANRPEGFSDGHKLVVGRNYPPLQPGRRGPKTGENR